MKVGDWVQLGEYIGVLVRPVVPEDDAYVMQTHGHRAWWALFLGDKELMWSYEDTLLPIQKGNVNV